MSACYYIAINYSESTDWIGFGISHSAPELAGSIDKAKAFTLGEAEAFIERWYKDYDWVSWRIFKMDLAASSEDSALTRLAREAT